MDNYEFVKKLGSGNFGVINLMRHADSGELVAVKQLPRGPKVDKNVYREVINHRKLSHPNVIGFKEVKLDTRYLYIVMEFAAGAWARVDALLGVHACATCSKLASQLCSLHNRKACPAYTKACTSSRT